MGLSDSEIILMIRSAVLTQYTHVTDRQMDKQMDGIGVAYTRYSIYAVAVALKKTIQMLHHAQHNNSLINATTNHLRPHR